MVWLPFLVAFAVATLTAFSYLELVTQVPAGRGCRAVRPQGVRHPLRDVPGRLRGDLLRHHQCLHLLQPAGREPARGPRRHRGRRTPRRHGHHRAGRPRPSCSCSPLINLRGVGESVKFNVVLTLVEMLALAIVIVDRVHRDGDRATRPGPDRGLRVRLRPGHVPGRDRGDRDRVLRDGRLRGLRQHGRGDPRARSGTSPGSCSPVSASRSSSTCWWPSRRDAVLPHRRQIQSWSTGGSGILLEVVKTGAPGIPIGDIFPFLTCLRGRQHRPDQHADGQPPALRLARQDVLPRTLGKVLPSRRTPWAGIIFTTPAGAGSDHRA